MICLATASKLVLVRPAKKTSAPSAANSLATAAPMEPAAPKTTAVLSCKARVFMGFSILARALTWLIHAFGLRWTKTVEGNGGGHLSMMGGLRRQRPGSAF